MALRLLSPPLSTLSASQSKLAQFSGSKRASFVRFYPKHFVNSGRRKSGLAVNACVKLEEKNVSEAGNQWGKVSAVLFDMDGVLCNSEEPSRRAAVDVFAEMGVEVTVEDFAPFTGMGKNPILFFSLSLSCCNTFKFPLFTIHILYNLEI